MKRIIYLFTICLLTVTINLAQAQTIDTEDSHAKAIRLALEAGGLNTTGHPSLSKDYGPFLMRAGFDTVATANYKPLPGDIRVFQPFIGGEPNGHIDMFDGEQWISDYKEIGFWPTPAHKKNNPAYQIFRWKKRN